MLVLDIQSHDSLNKAKARLKAAGLPLTYEEFVSLYPASSNAKNSFESLFPIGPPNPTKAHNFEIEDFTRPLAPEVWVDLEAIEPSLDKYLHAIGPVENLSGLSSRIRKNGPLLRLTEEMKFLRQATDALLTKAMLEFHRSNRLASLKLVKSAIKVSQLSINNPNLFFNLIDINERNCLLILSEVLEPGQVTSQEAQVVAEMRGVMKPASPLRLYLATEAMRDEAMYSSFRKLTPAATPVSASWQVNVFVKLIHTSIGRFGEAEVLDILAKCVESESKPGTTLLDLYKIQERLSSRLRSPGHFDLASHFNVGVHGSTEITVRGMMRHRAHLDLLDAALGRKTGNDPFTNLPYLSVSKSNRLIKYSVGPDFVDNKGDNANDIALPVLSSIMKPGS